MTRVFARRELTWRTAGDALALCHGQTVLVHMMPDPRLPGMWRVRYRDGRISDMANITRAKETSIRFALAELNRQEMRPEGSSVRRTRSPVSGRYPPSKPPPGGCGEVP
jgi:hypothetical protein